MDCYKIAWKSSAKKEIKKLPKDIIIKIIAEINKLATNPYPLQSKKIRGHNDTHRLRIGKYRVVYTAQDKILSIEIIKVGSRQSIYKFL